MDKLSYSRRNDSYNGKVLRGDWYHWGYYTRNGEYYLVGSNLKDNTRRFVLLSSDIQGYSAKRFWYVVDILRGTHFCERCVE